MENEKIDDFYRQKPDAGIGLSEDGRPQYGGMEGLEILHLPATKSERNAGRNVETVAVRDLPQHIISRVQQSLNSGIYIHEKPHQVFAHYAGALEGLGAVDTRTLRRLNELTGGLARAEDQREFFEDQVRPYLSSLGPKPGKP